MIQINNPKKTYKKGKMNVEVLKGITFRLSDGEHAALLGKSGSGKTTLLNLIGAMDLPTEGGWNKYLHFSLYCIVIIFTYSFFVLDALCFAKHKKEAKQEENSMTEDLRVWIIKT